MKTPQQWAATFADHGLDLLSIAPSDEDPNTLTLYLNGNSGQWAGDVALDTLSAIEGVIGAVASPQTPAIIRVWVA